MGERGAFRSVYSVLLDDLEFQRLTPAARHVFLTLRLCSQNNQASIFRLYMGTLSEQTGYPLETLSNAIQELVDTHWIAYREPIVWLRNGLRFEPGTSLKNPKHRQGIFNCLKGLPASPLIAEFCRYYGLEVPHPCASRMPIDTHSNGDRMGVDPHLSLSPSLSLLERGVRGERSSLSDGYREGIDDDASDSAPAEADAEPGSDDPEPDAVVDPEARRRFDLIQQLYRQMTHRALPGGNFHQALELAKCYTEDELRQAFEETSAKANSPCWQYVVAVLTSSRASPLNGAPAVSPRLRRNLEALRQATEIIERTMGTGEDKAQ